MVPLLSLRLRISTGPALWSRKRMEWFVDALRRSLLWAPRDNLRIRPGLLVAAMASAIAPGGGPRERGDGERSFIWSSTRSDTDRSGMTDRDLFDGDGYA